MSYITCEKVALAYEGRVIVKNLSFTVDCGDYVCVVGENGSGKTTLVKTLVGLKRPSSGKITFGDGLCRKDIGYVPQNILTGRDFPATVYEVVSCGLLNRTGIRPFFTKNEKKRVSDAMARLGIEDIKDRCFRELSGGQRQRVQLARALCATEKLLILDEPASGLDPVITKQLYGIIRELNKNDGVTVVMVSHDIKSAVHNASKILHIDNDSSFFGSADEYRENKMGKHFLGCTCDECRGGKHD